MPLSVMESAALFDKDGDDACSKGYYHRDKTGKFAENYGEEQKRQKTDTNGCCCERQESSSNAHELQWLLKTFEDGVTLKIQFHLVSSNAFYIVNEYFSYV